MKFQFSAPNHLKNVLWDLKWHRRKLLAKRPCGFWEKSLYEERMAVLPSPSFQIADRWTSFWRILVWFCGFYSQYFLNRERERKTTRRTRENDAGITQPSHFTKKSVILELWNRRSSRQNCFTVTCETERWRGGKKGQVILGDAVDIIVSSFITLLERKTVVCGSRPTPSDVDRFARFSWDWPSRNGKCQ